MINVDKFSVGMLFIGAALGRLITGLPAPLDAINSYLSIIFIVVGIIFLIMR